MSRTRLLCCQTLYQVCYKKQHLKTALQTTLPPQLSAKDRAWIQNVSYQTLRHYFEMQARWQKFIDKPLKDQMIGLLFSTAITQAIVLKTPAHAVVNESVSTARKLKKSWACGLLNKVLRLAIQDGDFSPQTEEVEYNHQAWWIAQLKKDRPEHWQKILAADNQKPPLWLRLKNPHQTPPDGKSHQHLSQAWQCAAGQEVAMVAEDYSVQDVSAQWAAHLLQPQRGEKILDSCAAPGGKSCHLLELQPKIQLDIVEQSAERMALIQQNLSRLKLTAKRLIVGDAAQPQQWQADSDYDKILLDVPCSASGVVRRNPDIKILRRSEQLKPLVELQQQILQSNAKLLKPQGRLLYATCSVFSAENERQIKRFLSTFQDFKEIPLDLPGAIACQHGKQIITGSDGGDGFYYCLLERQ